MLGGQDIRRVRELGDVEAAGIEVTGHAVQMPQHVIEGEQMAQRVEHGDGEVEAAHGVGEAEVPHIRLDHGQADPGRLGQLLGSPAHGRVEVERGGGEPAPGKFASVLRGSGRHLQHRTRRPGIGATVAADPP